MIYDGKYITAVNQVGNESHRHYGLYVGYVLRDEGPKGLRIVAEYPDKDPTAAEQKADAKARALTKRDQE